MMSKDNTMNEVVYTASTIPFSLVVSVAQASMAIGNRGKLLWHLKSDLAYFKYLTSTTSSPGVLRNVVIMGRKTYESIDPSHRPLKNRINIVISSNPFLRQELNIPPEVQVCDSLSAALEWVAQPSVLATVYRVFVIGGRSLYIESLDMPNCKKIFMTLVEADVAEADTFFPLVSATQFRMTTRSDRFVEKELVYRFTELERIEESHMFYPVMAPAETEKEAKVKSELTVKTDAEAPATKAGATVTTEPTEPMVKTEPAVKTEPEPAVKTETARADAEAKAAATTIPTTATTTTVEAVAENKTSPVAAEAKEKRVRTDYMQILLDLLAKRNSDKSAPCPFKAQALKCMHAQRCFFDALDARPQIEWQKIAKYFRFRRDILSAVTEPYRKKIEFVLEQKWKTDVEACYERFLFEESLTQTIQNLIMYYHVERRYTNLVAHPATGVSMKMLKLSVAAAELDDYETKGQQKENASRAAAGIAEKKAKRRDDAWIRNRIREALSPKSDLTMEGMYTRGENPGTQWVANVFDGNDEVMTDFLDKIKERKGVRPLSEYMAAWSDPAMTSPSTVAAADTETENMGTLLAGLLPTTPTETGGKSPLSWKRARSPAAMMETPVKKLRS